jgi:DNA-binding CsgD family transcriptional regulator
MLRAAEAVATGRAGHPDTARVQFAAAVTDLRGYQGGEWMAHLAQWLVAPAAFASGWGNPAAMQAAVRWFTDHRYEPLAASCRRMLREAGVPVPRAGRGSSEVPDALRALGVTSREVDVLHLVVPGLSNRDIARQLVLSPKTVEKHVASLLDKTGRPDRAALRTAYASMGAAPQPGAG